MSKSKVAILFLGFLFGACTSEAIQPEAAPSVPSYDAMVADAQMHPHDAMCGCSIEGIGACGTYIEIEGEFVPLVYAGLGRMEFCAAKASGVQIEVAGKMEDGKFVASSYQRVN